MTIYSKRRGGRSLAAIVAAMLVASVLAVVAGSPVQAANTSFEVKVDHDNNASTAMVREFAGQDRYDTALRLAKNFATSKGGLGSVPTAFIASGETLVDSISVAGLAGYTDAPILLTPTGSLHGGVADFIEDYGVSTVYVLGGTAAVSDATVTAIEGLSSEPTVTRIAGADRYATAAAVAGMIDAESSWCGTDAVSAVLINGATDMLAYGVAVQTIAYRLQLPVLMTAADMLPDATAEFIDDNDVEHVQIVGGTSAVSADVASALTTLGVDTVARVAGDSAAAVSVALAQAAGNGCGDSLGLVSTDRVALVRGNPDGVVSAPVLASSLAGGFLVPPLVVGDSLPASVRDYLAATPKNIGANRLNLGIVAVGGTAAVSEATMDAALAAAASSGALSVQIGSYGGWGADGAATLAVADIEGDTNRDGTTDASDPIRPNPAATGARFTLYFSDGVAPDLGRLQDIIEINGVPAVVTAVAQSRAGGTCDNRRIDVTLGQALRAGDTISVASSDATFGTGEDKRTVASASETVMAAPPDRVRPTISIVGIAGASGTERQVFDVSFADNSGSIAGTAQLLPSEVRVVAGPGGAAVETTTFTHTAGTSSVQVSIGRNLVPGDRLIVNPGAVADEAGNVSPGTSGAAIRAQASPRITSVLMSSLKHTAHASWTVPAGSVAGVGETGAAITITAKGDGAAAGAAGNGWDMVFDRASTYSSAKPLDIDVRVDSKGQRVTVRFNNGPTAATLSDLLAALKADAEFDALFSAGFTDCTAAATNNAGRVQLGLVTARNVPAGFNDSGRTQFAVEVSFSAYVDAITNNELLTDILAATAVRTRASAAETVSAGFTRINTGALGGDNTAASGGLTIFADLNAASPALPNVAVGGTTAPVRSIRYEFETSQVRLLPMARDLVETPAGAAELADDPNTAATETAFRPPVTGIATGYAPDVNTSTALARVDQSMNGASQRRIAMSGSVKAPS
ncbi:MAG: cell wall-binding repeat-containing protein [Acidimicrobiaceae bacterium]|nr:cell wall-binding repeat-containing protein [Acidimicrobiaceae bacterium]